MKINLSLRALAVLCLEGDAARCNGAEFRLRVNLAMHPDDRYDERARNEAIGFTRPTVFRSLPSLDGIIIAVAISAERS